jgi:heptose I phosphotransferase
MPDRMWVNPEYATPLREAGFLSLSDFFSLGRTIRSVGGKVNAEARVPFGGGVLRVFLKRHAPSRRPPGLLEWENLKTLAGIGIPVPEALAAGAGPPGSFLMTREVGGGVPLDRFLAEGLPGGREGALLKRKLAREAAGLARTLHGAGLCHRDFYLCHLLVVPSEGHRLVLLDLQRVRRAFPFRDRWIVKDLAALRYSSDGAVASRADRLRFLLEYLGTARVDPAARRWIRKIEAKAGRIRRHEERKAR